MDDTGVTHSMDPSELIQREYNFGPQTLQIYSRKYAQDTNKVSIAMQATVEQIWESFWNFSGSAEPASPVIDVPGTEAGLKEVAAKPSDLLGLDVWPGALSLCNYLATHKSMVSHRRVLELGAGTGLPGLLAAKLGAQEVFLTDYEPLVLDLLNQNIALNGVEGTAHTAALDWLAPSAGTLPSGSEHAFHLVLAADVLYIENIVLAFVGAVQALLHPEGVALVGHQTRRPLRLDPATGVPELAQRDEPFEAFLCATEAAGLVTRQLAELDVGGSAGPLFLLALAWDASYISGLDAVPSRQ